MATEDEIIQDTAACDQERVTRPITALLNKSFEEEEEDSLSSNNSNLTSIYSESNQGYQMQQESGGMDKGRKSPNPLSKMNQTERSVSKFRG